ncbi:hypothetical protein BU26DRAFT_571443 [Trematosphaeria pertusa]|uniref:Uncharacterized protein n=1 Tax=Trematosphaeria pertusa TaxID=390896 RepID=A0A6A6HUJ5_9PLEO|nr:uncharacterized protein BU26DRAFT_571443 [Trematosphaeria pertusa]KAF2241681.1 hypothetical protein BU26DRAFT_571443 [Trematosphaeria pertusa]
MALCEDTVDRTGPAPRRSERDAVTLSDQRIVELAGSGLLVAVLGIVILSEIGGDAPVKRIEGLTALEKVVVALRDTQELVVADGRNYNPKSLLDFLLVGRPLRDGILHSAIVVARNARWVMAFVTGTLEDGAWCDFSAFGKFVVALFVLLFIGTGFGVSRGRHPDRGIAMGALLTAFYSLLVALGYIAVSLALACLMSVVYLDFIGPGIRAEVKQLAKWPLDKVCDPRLE